MPGIEIESQNRHSVGRHRSKRPPQTLKPVSLSGMGATADIQEAMTIYNGKLY